MRFRQFGLPFPSESPLDAENVLNRGLCNQDLCFQQMREEVFQRNSVAWPLCESTCVASSEEENSMLYAHTIFSLWTNSIAIGGSFYGL